MGDCVACGVAEGITLALGAGLGRVSALLAQAENSARPSKMCIRDRFIRITGAGLLESHPHDIAITTESPNYSTRG